MFISELFIRTRKISDALQHLVARRSRQEIRQRTGVVEKNRGHDAQSVDRFRHQLRGSHQRSRVLRPENRRAGLEVLAHGHNIGREFTVATNQVDFAVPAGGRPQGLRPEISRPQ